MGIPVKLDAFEGPLDLLPHLIDKNKVNIYDIPIVEITRQYLEYIREVQRQDLKHNERISGDGSQTLLDIKSRVVLLPKEVNEEGRKRIPGRSLQNSFWNTSFTSLCPMSFGKSRKMLPRRCFAHAFCPRRSVRTTGQPADVSDLLGDMTLAGLYRLFEKQ